MTQTPYRTTTLGYPRVGRSRAYKWMLEQYWAGQTDATTLEAQAAAREAEALSTQRGAGIDLVACGDFSLYDHVLDTALMLDCIPDRYQRWTVAPPEPRSPNTQPPTPPLYFAMARGAEGVPACEMTKWFDTNYHYLVPELPTAFRLAHNPLLAALHRARAVVGDAAKPWVLGPFTFLRLAGLSGAPLVTRLEELTPLYQQLLREVTAAAPPLVQIDEPALVGDVTEAEWAAVARCYDVLADACPDLCLQTYYGDVATLWPRLLALPVRAIGIDMVAGRERNMAALLAHPVPADKQLVLGIVDGRNVWRSDLEDRRALVQEIARIVPPERLLLSPSCSLLHLPETVEDEERLPAALRDGLCFARERLRELSLLARALREGVPAVTDEWSEAAAMRRRWLSMEGRVVPAVRERTAALPEKAFHRTPYSERAALQQARLQLPPLPTTTIGSFPQTAELRHARAGAAQDPSAYERAIREEIERVIRLQEELGLDILVHGEPERNDMVQFFAEQLSGFAATRHGWVQSYGSRCVRPPLLFGEIRREQSMTVELSRFAQSLTATPVKGMLTGPVTMLQWSFVRDDLPRAEVAVQLAIAIRDEVAALESDAGLRVIQIDEPAFREGLPLRRADWDAYLQWAVRAFRLAAAGATAETQVHTHMCYSEFRDILAAIAALDADVLSIEDARSYGEMLETLRDFQYPAGIGPGVYDIHSPNIPTVEAMAAKIRRTLELLPLEQVWVNPDCGLKTRRYEEVTPALRNMVAAARQVREELLRDTEAGATGEE
jgi:5-methyltetrahydropteroyltriglutamate--homocysteine methyltransferase